MPGIVTNELERGYVNSPYPHQPPPATDLDAIGHAAGSLAPNAFNAVVRSVPCPCRRGSGWTVGYATHQPPEPTKYHAITYQCPLCVLDGATAGANLIPAGLVDAGLPAGERRFALGSLWAGRMLLSHPLLGHHAMFPLLYKHLSGDFGAVGSAAGVEPTAADAEAGPLASVVVRNLLAVRSRSGLVRSAYPVGDRTLNLTVHVATALHPERGDSTVIDLRRHE